MRRSGAGPTVSLFPFLAVLLCAMGALILLLLVTTRKMRQVAEARAIQPAEPSPPPAEALPSPEDRAEELAEQRRVALAAREREIAAIHARREAADQAQAEREREWRQKLVELQISRDQHAEKLANSRLELGKITKAYRQTEHNLEQLELRKKELDQARRSESSTREELEAEHARLTDDIEAQLRKIAELKKARADAESKFVFIPYDGASGTTRRPIYIECTGQGLRFLPENEFLEENDLKGFTESLNPLVVGVQALSQYWARSARAQPESQRPYVLLLVRPSGTVAYYVARKFLNNFAQEFGYELIEEDLPLQFPPADPQAKLALQQAIAKSLRAREELYAGRQGSPSGLGAMVQFGSLSNEEAAEESLRESPFGGTPREQALRGFSVSRSPVRRDELLKPSTPPMVRGTREIPGGGQVTDFRPGGIGTGSNGRTGTSGPRIMAAATPGGGASSGTAGEDYKPIPPAALFDPQTGGTGRANDSERTEGRDFGSLDGTDAASSSNGSKGGSGLTAGKPGTTISPNLAGKIPDQELTEPDKLAPYLQPAEISDSGSSQEVARNGSEAGSSEPSSQPSKSSPRGPAGSKPDPSGLWGTRSASTSPRSGGTPGSASSPAKRPNMLGAGDPQFAKNGSAGQSGSGNQSIVSSLQKRQLGRQRWGGNPEGQLGFERQVKVEVNATSVSIPASDIHIPIDPEEKSAQVVEKILSALDEVSAKWGPPPSRFYWVPFLEFSVKPGGEANYERLHSPLREWGLYSEVKFVRATTPAQHQTTTTPPPKKAGKPTPNPFRPAKL